MPKKIRNAESKIIDAAEKLFKEKGFEKSDMKEVARRAGVAVGTLYNYWPSKRTLFNTVSLSYWNNAFEKFDSILESDVDSHLKSMLFIKNLYDYFETEICTSKSGVDTEALAFLIEVQEIRFELYLYMGKLIRELLKSEMKSIEERDLMRIARTVSLAMISFIIDFPNDKKSNVEFINRMLTDFL